MRIRAASTWHPRLILPRRASAPASSVWRPASQTLDDMETGSIPITEQQSTSEDESVNCRELEVLLEENRKLQTQCLEYDANEKELQERVRDLENELQEVQREYAKLLIESQSLSIVKEET